MLHEGDLIPYTDGRDKVHAFVALYDAEEGGIALSDIASVKAGQRFIYRKQRKQEA